MARLEGKSSLGRLGLLIHSTAGYVDPGWKGNLTLELSNVANLPIALYFGMKIGQISFFKMIARWSGRTARRSSARSTRASPSRPRRPSTATSRTAAGQGGAGRAGARATPLNDAVDWRRDLGGGTTVALVQAGTFRSDAGALFGPVPRMLWDRWVTDEIDDENRLLQALNCLLVETPAGRVLVETGIGDRLDDKTRADARLRGAVDRAGAREAAGFDPATVDVVAMSHLHFDHAGGLLAADGSRAFPRATIVAQRAEWEIALGDNPRLVASYVQPELELVRDWGAEGWADGERELLPGRVASSRPAATRPATRRSSSGRRVAAPLAFFGDLVHAAVERQPALGDGVRRLPARLRSTSRRRCSRGPPTRSWTVVLSHEVAAARRPARPRPRSLPVDARLSRCSASGASTRAASAQTGATPGSARSNRLVTSATRRISRFASMGRPAMISSARRHSSAVRASGPTVSRLHAAGKTPSVGTSPHVGL